MVGNVAIGGGAPIAIQSMTNTDTKDFQATLSQIKLLEEAGCELIRISIPNQASLKTFSKLKEKASVPLIADIHFRWQLAVEAIKVGADKIRINPGNIGGQEALEKVVEAAKQKDIPIRIGINAGSIEEEFHRLDIPLWKKLVASAKKNIALVEAMNFNKIVVSAKAFSLLDTISVYQTLAKATEHPLHIGITESGPLKTGAIRSAVGLGVLLWQGIGDTIRVSLSANPVEEVMVAKQILQSLEIRRFQPDLISCPTCSRCQVDLIPIATETEKQLQSISRPLKVAIMGCIVNGPGEAEQADVGIAAGKEGGILFKKGKPVKKVTEREMLTELLKAIKEMEN